MMLPYIEQTTTYNAINFNIVSENAGNGDDIVPDDGHHAVDQRVPLPLEPGAALLAILHASRQYIFPGNTYFASVGSAMNQYGNSPYAELTVGSAAPNGMFQVFGPAIGIQSVTDGTSNTIAMGEWITGSNSPTMTLPQDVVVMGTTLPAGASPGSPLLLMPAGGCRLQCLAPAVCPADTGDERHGQSSQ